MAGLSPLLVFVVCRLLEKRFEYVKCRITSPAVCLFGYTTVLYWRRSYLSSHVSDARQRERKQPRWKTPSLSFFLSLCGRAEVIFHVAGRRHLASTGRSHATHRD